MASRFMVLKKSMKVEIGGRYHQTNCCWPSGSCKQCENCFSWSPTIPWLHHSGRCAPHSRPDTKILFLHWQNGGRSKLFKLLAFYFLQSAGSHHQWRPFWYFKSKTCKASHKDPKGGPLRAGRLEMANIPVHSLHSSCWPSIFCKVLGAIISEDHFGTSNQKHASIPILSVSCVTLQQQVPSIERNLEFQKPNARLKHRLKDVAELVDVPSCVFVKYRKAGCYRNLL